VAAFEAPPAFGLIFAVILKGKILQTYMKIREDTNCFCQNDTGEKEVL
jgi:hypothetical protein